MIARPLSSHGKTQLHISIRHPRSSSQTSAQFVASFACPSTRESSGNFFGAIQPALTCAERDRYHFSYRSFPKKMILVVSAAAIKGLPNQRPILLRPRTSVKSTQTSSPACRSVPLCASSEASANRAFHSASSAKRVSANESVLHEGTRQSRASEAVRKPEGPN